MFAKAFLLFRDLRFDLRFAHHWSDDAEDDNGSDESQQLQAGIGAGATGSNRLKTRAMNYLAAS